MTADGALLDAAQRLADAERRGDVGALEQIIGADYTGYDPAGRHQDRTGVLRAYTDGRVRVATLGQSELSARVVGEVGLVTGVSAFRGKQGDEPFDFPVGAIIAKTFSFAHDLRDLTLGEDVIETRLLVRRQGVLEADHGAVGLGELVPLHLRG